MVPSCQLYDNEACTRLVKLTGSLPFLATNISSKSFSQSPATKPFFTPNFISKVCISTDTTSLISCMARFLPTQLEGPCEKGMNASLLRTTLSNPPAEVGSQRSG